MQKLLKQSIFALLIGSVLAFNGLAQSAKVSYHFLQDKKPDQGKKSEDKRPEKLPEKKKEPKNEEKPKDDKKKP